MELHLDAMSVEEKLQVMEAIWEDLSHRDAELPSPDWHGEILAEREARLRRGETRFIDWEQAKRELRDETAR